MSRTLHLRKTYQAIALCGREVADLLVSNIENERVHDKKYPRCKSCLRALATRRKKASAT